MTLNGADASDWDVTFGEEITGQLVFLGFDYNLGNIESWIDDMAGLLPPGAVPIAIDPGGNVFAATPGGRVIFWDHDIRQVAPAFDTIPQFIDALVYVEPPARTGIDYGTMPRAELISLIDADPDLHGRSACMARRVDVVDHLLAHHSTFGPAYLITAVHVGAATLVDALLDGGIGVDVRHNDYTALAVAVETSNASLVSTLLGLGADPTLECHGIQIRHLSVDDEVLTLVEDALGT
jgi:hypothetical protein